MSEGMKVPFFRFTYGDSELENIRDVLDSGWLTTGRYAAELERQFAERCGVKYALAVNSCTAGLHLLLDAIGVSAGDKVVVPSLTFTATAEVVRYLGADPIIADVDSNTGLLTSTHLRKAIERHGPIKACMVVHFAGQSAELTGPDGLLAACSEHGAALLQDAAHAFPSFDDYGPVGSVGDGTAFSFYANKTITTGEGGMVVTNDEAVAKRIKVMRLHGIDRDVWNRFTSPKASWDYDVVAPGYKYNMPDLNAAVGLAQLQRADVYRENRQAIALRYDDQLSAMHGIRTLRLRVRAEQHAWHLYPVILESEASVGRNELIELLRADGIGTSVHYRPLHRMSYYADTYSLSERDFPNTEAYWQGCVSLPIFPSMTFEQVDYVCDRLRAHLGA